MTTRSFSKAPDGPNQSLNQSLVPLKPVLGSSIQRLADQRRISNTATMKIWINQGFSLYNLVSKISHVRPDVDLCVSATDPHAPVRDVAPTFWVEPGRDAQDYPVWLLNTAIRNGVDALMVQRGRSAVAEMLPQFHASRIKAHVPATAAVLELLDNKARFSENLTNDAHLCRTIPATTVAMFENAVRVIEQDGATACVKPARGIYGAGYWTLTGHDPFAHLANPDARIITSAMFATGLQAKEDSGEPFSLIVMEFLPGLEASIDIVAQNGATLLAAVRTKLDANRQRLQTRHALIEHATMLVDRYRLHGAVNIQYRQDRTGHWRILEINTRPAGGASYCDAVGIPFAATWIDVALGRAERFTADVDREIVATVTATTTRQ